ncbi:uncharacterized protein LOC123504534 isoform X2 [Portunus trituberculatus]|uniref:uncharacterized protein LOC123504534 isoform X2 n=1 Tax=Portunus trituberculatus TaxID=210409 RepID=UPI001E1D1BE4|nr:uncharacterized protein LOC123504534 isoform X2 [Portunus trituberculatus]
MIFCGDGLLYFILVSSGVLGNCTNTEHAEAQGRQRNGRGVRTWTAIVAKYSCSSTNTKNSVKEEKAGWHSRTYQTTHGFPREDYRDCVVSTMIAEVAANACDDMTIGFSVPPDPSTHPPLLDICCHCQATPPIAEEKLPRGATLLLTTIQCSCGDNGCFYNITVIIV